MSAQSQPVTTELFSGLDAGRKDLYQIGGTSALLQLATVLVIFVVSATLGTRPTSAQEYFRAYQENPLAGILRDDFTSLFLVAMYLGTFPALYVALRRVNPVAATFATLFTFAAVITCFATHSGFSLIHLSQQYAAAAGDAQRAQFLAAGEAILAADMWNSSGAYLSGILLQGGGIIISVVMLRSRDFSKATAIAGMLGNAFDLSQHVLHPFAPSVSAALMMAMGPFYLAWFPLLARDLFRLARTSSNR